VQIDTLPHHPIPYFFSVPFPRVLLSGRKPLTPDPFPSLFFDFPQAACWSSQATFCWPPHPPNNTHPPQFSCRVVRSFNLPYSSRGSQVIAASHGREESSVMMLPRRLSPCGSHGITPPTILDFRSPPQQECSRKEIDFRLAIAAIFPSLNLQYPMLPPFNRPAFNRAFPVLPEVPPR